MKIAFTKQLSIHCKLELIESSCLGIKNWEILKLNKITNINYLGIVLLSIMFLLFTSYDIDFTTLIKT